MRSGDLAVFFKPCNTRSCGITSQRPSEARMSALSSEDSVSGVRVISGSDVRPRMAQWPVADASRDLYDAANAELSVRRRGDRGAGSLDACALLGDGSRVLDVEGDKRVVAPKDTAAVARARSDDEARDA